MTTRSSRIARQLASALALMLLGACGGVSDGATSDAPSGRLSLAVTDAPVDEAANVVVEFSGVSVQNDRDKWLDFSFITPRQIDLLNLAGGGSEVLLDGVELPAGDYQAIRLQVNAANGVTDTYITLSSDGQQYPMSIPSGYQSGLKLNHAFTISASGLSAFTIDFDLRKSVVKPASANQDYKLKPSLRLVDNLKVGRIVGRVAAERLSDLGCDNGPNHDRGNAVYLYPGWGVTPDDVGGSGAEPLISAPVLLDANSNYSYTLAYVAAGDYTIAFTCQGMNDAVESDEVIAFVQPTQVSITAGAVAEVNFN